jgi:peptidoglycan hydrolase CwlO-like protein
MENVPIYVKVDKYKELVEVLKAINTKLQSIDKTIERVNQLKSQEDLQLQSWTENLSDIKGRLEKINKAFYD